MPAPQVSSTAFSRTTQNRVLVQYSINVNTTDAQTNGNYSIPGLGITSVSYNSGTFVATITTTGQANGTGYTVTVSNVKDAATGTFTIGSPTNTFSFRQSDLLKTLAAQPTVMTVSHIIRANKTNLQPFAGTGSSAGGTTVVRQTSGFNQGTN